MARTLPTALLNAVQNQQQQPTLTVTLHDLVTRFLSPLASGGHAGNSDGLLTSAGTIIRAVVEQSTGNLYATRVTSPATTSQWTAATLIGSGTAKPNAGCQLTRSGTTIRIWYQQASDNRIVHVDSTNDGQSWGAPITTMPADPVGIGHFVYAIAGDNTHIWIADQSYAGTAVASTIYRSSYTTSWSAWAAEGPAGSWGSVQGLECVVRGSTYYFLGGFVVTNGVTGISACSFTWNGTTYTPLVTVLSQDNPSLGLSWSNPGLFDDGTTFWATFTQTDDGTKSGTAQTRTIIYTSTDFITWTPWGAIGTGLQYGANTIIKSGVAYIFDGVTVYSAASKPALTDVSNDVLEISIHERQNQPATCAIVLANGSGTYNTDLNTRADATVQISLGYGSNTILTHTLLIDTVAYETSDTANVVRLDCRDHAKLLDYQNDRMWVYSGQTLSALITQVAALAGATLATLPTTQQFSQTVPCFMVTPGETWLHALDRLSQIYGFDWFADEAPSIVLKEYSSADASTWTYTQDALALLWANHADAANYIRVIGVDAKGQAVWASILDASSPTGILTVGKERYKHTVDRLLDTSAKCKIRATLELNAEQRASFGARLVVAMNPAHQIGDVITLSDTWTGLSGHTARITELTLTIVPDTGEWAHQLTCVGA